MIRRILLPCAAAILAAAGLWYAAAGRNRTTYFLLEGTSLETEVCEIRGKDEGLGLKSSCLGNSQGIIPYNLNGRGQGSYRLVEVIRETIVVIYD